MLWQILQIWPPEMRGNRRKMRGNRRKMRGNRRKMRGNRRKAQNQLVLNMAGRTEMCVFGVNERVFQQCALFLLFKENVGKLFSKKI